MTQQQIDETRWAEAMRLRKYRKAKKTEVHQLKTELLQLEADLNRLNSKARQPTAEQTRSLDVSQQLLGGETLKAMKENQALRDQVERQRSLARLLMLWVASDRTPTVDTVTAPSINLSVSTAHINVDDFVRATHAPLYHQMRPLGTQLTLLANPVARREGFLWICQRVYHTATRAFPPQERPGCNIDGAMRFQMHTCDDDDDGVSIAAMDLQIQAMFHANYKELANGLWRRLVQDTFMKSRVIVSSEVVEPVNPNILYTHGVYSGTGSTARRILSIFVEPTRIIITICLVAEDEQYPLADGELRTHGFGWIIFEQMTDCTTLVRYSLLHLAPISNHGKAPLERVGRMFGQPVDSIVENRNAHIERIGQVAEKWFLEAYQEATRALHLIGSTNSM
ncbi:Aste57867_13293 [Aphanomyces stellatus]|uniref:Aste57867_13293 protein n=1 Tax=Aphanomyces stellatus TaxID=120398 RepID=A0A485KZG2_9STRA|nr:hypothetical protein As57867_013244 [Aphanomyces stellatus]VFT90132.1 Aste57867_13293 [Aphanomyces stellatus]